MQPSPLAARSTSHRAETRRIAEQSAVLAPQRQRFAYGYSGEFRDPNGLLPYGFRVLDPASGTWRSPDPARTRGSSRAPLNFYQMVESNPATFRDDRGLTKQIVSPEHVMAISNVWSDNRVASPMPPEIFILIANFALPKQAKRDEQRGGFNLDLLFEQNRWKNQFAINWKNKQSGSYYRDILEWQYRELQRKTPQNNWLTHNVVDIIYDYINAPVFANKGPSTLLSGEHKSFSRFYAAEFWRRIRQMFNPKSASYSDASRLMYLLAFARDQGMADEFEMRAPEPDTQEMTDWAGFAKSHTILSQFYLLARDRSVLFIDEGKFHEGLRRLKASNGGIKSEIFHDLKKKDVWSELLTAFKTMRTVNKRALIRLFYEGNYLSFNLAVARSDGILSAEQHKLELIGAQEKNKSGLRQIFFGNWETAQPNKLPGKRHRKKPSKNVLEKIKRRQKELKELQILRQIRRELSHPIKIERIPTLSSSQFYASSVRFSDKRSQPKRRGPSSLISDTPTRRAPTVILQNETTYLRPRFHHQLKIREQRFIMSHMGNSVWHSMSRGAPGRHFGDEKSFYHQHLSGIKGAFSFVYVSVTSSTAQAVIYDYAPKIIERSKAPSLYVYKYGGTTGGAARAPDDLRRLVFGRSSTSRTLSRSNNRNRGSKSRPHGRGSERGQKG